MAIRLVLDMAGLKLDAAAAAVPRVRSVTRRVLNQSTVNCPVDTGRLRASGKMKFRVAKKGPRGTVEYNVKYAAAVHDGTGPYIIKPKRKKVLRFEVRGRVVFAKKVHHPGIKGRPFLVRAARTVASAEGLRFVPSKSKADATP